MLLGKLLLSLRISCLCTHKEKVLKKCLRGILLKLYFFNVILLRIVFLVKKLVIIYVKIDKKLKGTWKISVCLFAKYDW